MVHQILFPGLSIIIIGLLASHITTEVDYEFLFSLSEYLSHLNRARTIAEVFESFERLVMAKYRLSRIYCCRFKVIAEYMERRLKKLWSEDNDWGDIEFWDQQK